MELGVITQEESAKIITAIKSTYTGSVTFYLSYNDGMSAYLDDVRKLSDFNGSNQNYYNFTVNLVQNKYYTFYGAWSHYYSTYDFSVAWSYSLWHGVMELRVKY